MSSPRYAIIQGDAVLDKRLTEIHLRVLLMLGRRTDEDGWCAVSQTKMAGEIGYSRQRINVAFGDLTAWGYVQKTDQFNKKNKGRTISRYRVCMDREPQDVVAPLSPVRDTPLSPLDVTTPVTSEGDNITTSFLTTIEKNTKKELDLEFGEFWSQYPKKQAKKPAAKSFEIARRSNSFETIMAGLSRKNAEWTRDETDLQFIPKPTAFLNQERFNDEPQPPKRTKASDRADQVAKYKRHIAEMFDPAGSDEGIGADGFGDDCGGETINGRCDVVAERSSEGSGQVLGGANQTRDFGASENIAVLAPSIGPDEAHRGFGEAGISRAEEAEGLFLEYPAQASKRSRQA